MNKIYDALIVGGGPAGLSTALALGRVHRTCIVFSDSEFRNQGAHAAHAILTRDHTPPAEIRRLGRKDIERYGHADFAECSITRVTRKEAGPHSRFLVHNDQGQQWQGRTLVLATGARDQFPDLDGYAENWPASIYQCPFCDGHERSDGPLGILCYPDFNPMLVKQATLSHFLSQPPGTPAGTIAKSNVTFFTNGHLDTGSPATAQALEILAAHYITLEQRPVVRLETSIDDSKPGLYVHLQNEDKTTSRLYMGFVYHKPRTMPSSPELIKQLDLEIESGLIGDYIKTTPPFESTRVPGVYACGDAKTMMGQVTVAMMTGNAAAAGVAHYLIELDDAIAVERYRREKESKEDVDAAVDGAVKGEDAAVAAL
ncbi:uncharacterized protein HMPREF1541_02021 [Cyphellophora europaea CBS 101466]|uniref:FAD/NAD(P)-binding domain-containing protein n=1 Tax=Cyphellophora europaea (strain CBS 101466) TaxID=1220924 RepID=W2S4A1_CYPE1|nr:uncharacterized protein HMPREF1541_02021 [Cyphellophora europaea CBS 101466]ETN42863.1 hypothetical protein HMPREF1541_02021 [Cyphellophora europaea CBS 101466]